MDPPSPPKKKKIEGESTGDFFVIKKTLSVRGEEFCQTFKTPLSPRCLNVDFLLISVSLNAETTVYS